MMRVGNLRKENSRVLPLRNSEVQSVPANGSPSKDSSGRYRVVTRSLSRKQSPPTPEKVDINMPCSMFAKDMKSNGLAAQTVHRDLGDSCLARNEHDQIIKNTTSVVEKSDVRAIEWPKIHIALSRKEKEDDFLAMNGTKLPLKPKKRAKNVDKAIKYCFPGMWLPDITKKRYEVKEERCVKKRKGKLLKSEKTLKHQKLDHVFHLFSVVH